MTANEHKSNQADKESNQPRVNLVTRKLTKKEEDIRNFLFRTEDCAGDYG